MERAERTRRFAAGISAQVVLEARDLESRFLGLKPSVLPNYTTPPKSPTHHRPDRSLQANRSGFCMRLL